MTCEQWDGDVPCERDAVEVLTFFNPLTGGTGQMAVCRDHLVEHIREHFPLASR